MVIWITGLSGSGKTTLATTLYESMKPGLPALVRIDGDEVRALFGNSLGFSESDLQARLDDHDLIMVTALGYPRSGNRMNLLQTHAVSDLVESLSWKK